MFDIEDLGVGVSMLSTTEGTMEWLGQGLDQRMGTTYSSDANRAEIAHEKRFLPVDHTAGHELISHENCWNASEDDDHDTWSRSAYPSQRQTQTLTEAKNSGYSNTSAIGILERCPRNDSTDVHETTEVEQDIDDTVDLIVASFGFLEILAIPVQPGTGDETGEEIIGSKHAAGPDDEQAQTGWQHKIGLAIDPASGSG